jgi:hypothetical protein
MSENNCYTNFVNPGNPKCKLLPGTLRRMILVPLTDNAGAAVEWANLAAFTKTALQTKCDEADLLDRIFPLMLVSQVEDQTGEREVLTDEYGFMVPIAHGSRTINAKGWLWPMPYSKNVASFNDSSNLGVIEVLSTGHIRCFTDSTNTKIKPIPIKGFYCRPIQDEKIGKTMISYSWDVEGDDIYNIKYIDKNDLDFNGLSTTDLYSLDNVVMTITSPTVSGFIITTKINGDIVTDLGLVVADLTLTDDSGGAETISSLTDNHDGTYTAAATLTADSYLLNGSKNRYDFAEASFTVAP